MAENALPENCPEPFIALAERLADTARGIVTGYFRRPLDVARKADESPVTAADREAETAMRALIAESFPEHGVVGEEHGTERAEADYVWVIDPLDGTKRFITGHAQFGCLIALLRHGQPILGVIDMPVLEERWVGAAGRPTVHSGHTALGEVRVRPCPVLGEAILYATSPHMFPGTDFAAFERVREAVRQPMYGSECYAYGLLASGFVDLVIESTMAVYDFMALIPVVTGAGGTITDWRGGTLGLDSDGRVLAAGDARCHAAALALLGGG